MYRSSNWFTLKYSKEFIIDITISRKSVIIRCFMKLFKTSNIRIIQLGQDLFHFELPSVQLARRRKYF